MHRCGKEWRQTERKELIIIIDVYYVLPTGLAIAALGNVAELPHRACSVTMKINKDPGPVPTAALSPGTKQQVPLTPSRKVKKASSRTNDTLQKP